jgi:hypothetical protein
MPANSPILYVMKATSMTLYRYSGGGPYSRMLMLRPDGIAWTAASSGPDQPLVEGVENFEVAIGSDTNNDGIITETLPATSGADEWLGNATGELAPWPNNAFVNMPAPTPPPPPAVPTPPQLPQYKQIRATLLARTTNTYPGDATNVATPVEDRNNSFNYSASGAGGAPRYRVMRVTVAPRVWNLLN